jgi:translocation and assembly module TamB
MKRPSIKYFVAAAVMALAGAVIAAAVWVVATTPGARWLLASAASLSGVNISVQKIEGRIIDHLLLGEVRVALAQQKLELDSLELRWKPLRLLAGTIAVQELVISGMRIQDDAPPTDQPPILAWPRAPGIGAWFDGSIARLRVTDLSYRRLQEQPLHVSAMGGSVTWQDGSLSIGDLAALFPSGQIHGRVSAGFKKPSLTADLVVALAQPVAGMDRFSLQASQSHDTGPEPLIGTVTVAGSAGTRRLMELHGDVGMAPNAVSLRRLSLSRPGQKGVVTADGLLTFATRDPVLTLQVKATGLDLGPELNVPTDLSGALTFAGTLDRYRGDFTLANQARGWQAVSVSAAYQGTREGVRVAPLTASFIDGSLAGNLDINWREGFTVQGALNGRNLNPARFDPAWRGVANFRIDGKLAWSGKSPLAGSISGTLLESRLHGQALTGELQATVADKNIFLTRLALQGKGFDLHASGDLSRRLVMTARISDFSRLVPGSAGTFEARGWVRRHEGDFSGSVDGRGNRLAYAGTKIAVADLTVRLGQGKGYPLHVAASLRDVVHDRYKLDAVTLAADGTPARHAVQATMRSPAGEVRLSLSAGYKGGIWEGEVTRLAGKDGHGSWNMAGPATFAVSAGKIFLSPLTLTAGAVERLEISADLTRNPLSGQVRAQWAGLNLARANPYLKDEKITGSSNGVMRLGFLPGERLTLTGNVDGSGTFSGRKGSVTLQRILATFDGGEQGLRVGLELGTADGGALRGTFSSPAPFSLVIPETGKLKAQLSGIDLALLAAWFPDEIKLEGRLSGQAEGILISGRRFELDGTAVVTAGILHLQRADGELSLAFTSASATWGWREDALAGTLSLAMAERGQVRASFQLPIASGLPVAVNPAGPLRASLAGQVQEKGMLTALFPGLVQESSGQLDVDLDFGGTWDAPRVAGQLRLARAGAYLPTAGIHLKDVQLEAHLENNLIRVDSFRARSGPGHIEGTALLTLDGWRLVGYRGTVSGENFQTVHLPELRILSTPKLSFEGAPQKLTVRGELQFPELNIVGTQPRTMVTPSSDVVMEGRVAPAVKPSPFLLDVRIRVLLGDKVFVKVAGIDAQLGGAVDLSASGIDRITSAGEIRVVKGRYRTYGVNLEIVRGRLFFAGGPMNRPSLDFLALRTIGDVRAGVTVAGTLQEPVTRLYSEPAMPDVDILAYIVLGHPLGSGGEQAGLVAQAAGALLTSSQAEILQERLKDSLGLSTLEIQGGVGATTRPMGYTPLQVTPPGTVPAAQQPGITETVLTVGKYLTPQLYISYGKSLFTGNNLFRLRYDIFKNWQIETQTGSGESGADLYYKLEFK